MKMIFTMIKCGGEIIRKLRNRSALVVICWVINHCLEVSCKVYQITSAEREWFIFLHWPTNWDLLLNKSRTRADLFRHIHIENDEKGIVSFRFFKLSVIENRNPANSFDCNADVYMHFIRCWREKNDVTPSNVVETKTDVSKVSKWCRNGAR